MTALFVALAGLALLAALGFIVLPLLRPDPNAAELKRRLAALDGLEDQLEETEWLARRRALRSEFRADAPRRPLPLALGLAVAVPAAAILLYLALGTPAGVGPPPSEQAQLRQLLGELTDRVRRQPDDLEAWATMGLIWKDLRQWPAAEAAWRRVLFYDPDNAPAQVELAETLLFASARPELPPESRQLLASALALEPDHQKALWLAGVDARQRGDFEGALVHWQRLEAVLPEGSVRSQIGQQIAALQTERSAPQPAPDVRLPPGHPPVAARSDTRAAGTIAIEVRLAPELAGRVSGAETVFVFARAADGPSLPLAVRRLQAAELPTTLSLSDADAMAEGMNLSAHDQIQLIARVSFTGDVSARPGDLEGGIGPLATAATAADGPVALTIDRILE